MTLNQSLNQPLCQSLGLHPAHAIYPQLTPHHALIIDVEEMPGLMQPALSALARLSMQLGGALAYLGGTGEQRPSDMALLIGSLLELQARFPALLIEHRKASATIHYRHAPHLQGIVQQAVARFMKGLDGFQVINGPLRCAISFAEPSRGDEVRDLMQTPMFAGRIPVFMGEGMRDESGFRAVNEMGGISARIGRGKTAAYYRFRDWAEWQEWVIANADTLTRE